MSIFTIILIVLACIAALVWLVAGLVVVSWAGLDDEPWFIQAFCVLAWPLPLVGMVICKIAIGCAEDDEDEEDDDADESEQGEGIAS